MYTWIKSHMTLSVTACHSILLRDLAIVSNHFTKFDGNRHCRNRDMMFLVY